MKKFQDLQKNYFFQIFTFFKIFATPEVKLFFFRNWNIFFSLNVRRCAAKTFFILKRPQSNLDFFVICVHLTLWPRLDLGNHLYNFACLSVCLIYPINVKTAQPIAPKLCVEPYVAPWKVYEWSKFQKFASNKFNFHIILKILDFCFVFVLQCIQRENFHNWRTLSPLK